MLSTCCTSTKIVLVLLIAAANLQLGVASPIVHRETCIVNLSPVEATLRDGLFVANFIADTLSLVSYRVCASIQILHEDSYIICCMLYLLTRLGKLN